MSFVSEVVDFYLIKRCMERERELKLEPSKRTCKELQYVEGEIEISSGKLALMFCSSLLNGI